ncbi:MAG: sigma-54-dependent Fis family transcriptional regulator [Deltaproteobacteria bacterium HGW-Deltaproteobacteria-11]|nr:MAG: sigma-54-dependent Fis family transcriptional regulator [Deltaproteobacteria bacterium HGW-Deltaproteobacteria-11]
MKKDENISLNAHPPETDVVTPANREAEALREQLEMYQLIFESIHYGSLVTDKNGYITHFNKPYGLFLGMDPDAQIGKHCTEVLENTRMHIVAQTGKPEFSDSQRIKGQNMVVHRIPIKKNGKVIAVFGQVLFKDVRDVGKLAKKLSLLESKVKLYEAELLALRSTRYTLDSIIGVSDDIASLKAQVLKAAASQFPVLISGESGTGKELFAQAIHHASPRKVYPFVRINCATIPRDLFESELFGYEKGAFTGARSEGKPGKFELAHRGTIFLDEIGELPVPMQPKLLRVLEEKEFERVGGTRVIRSNFRLIAATNQNLESMIREGSFRKDLFYRLNVFPITIPPLRERQEDILPLFKHLLQLLSAEADLFDIRLDSSAHKVLMEHAWPGNVRELSNVLEWTLSSLEGNCIRDRDLPFYLKPRPDIRHPSVHSPMREVQVRAEAQAIRQALQEAGHNKARASRILGIHRTLLYKKIKKYGLDA